MEGDKVFKTKFLSKILEVSRLSFAQAEDMEKYLGLYPGSASVLGLMNDVGKNVRLIIDRPVIEKEFIGCHPCDNTATLKIKTSDIIEKFLPYVGHEATIVDLPEDDLAKDDLAESREE